MIGVIVMLCLVRQSFGVIYKLNDSEYFRMPALYAIDDYEECVSQPGAQFCLVDLVLYSDQPSPLLQMIQEYSAHKKKHFNHTQIHRGVCVHRSCSQYIPNSTDLGHVLEQCVNNRIYNEYKLNARLKSLEYCVQKDEPIPYDNSDLLVAIVIVALIALNCAGTLYDLCCCGKDSKSGNPYLLAFSVGRNYRKLVAPSGQGPDPRLNRLKVFSGLRAMTMIAVFFSHTSLVLSFGYVSNPLFIEQAYEDPLKQLLFNGSLVTYTFFVMSSFLLGYNFMISTEKTGISWTLFPKGVLLRWLRLTPVYALVVGVVSTIGRHFGDGPFWPLIVTSEADACRQYWWAHLLYINNYIYEDALCVPQTWYLAADTQLFCLGLLVCVCCRSNRSRRNALIIMFILSLLIPAAHTYWQDLEAVVIQSPESYRAIYADDPTFRLLYARGHTNMSTYTLGLAGGFIVYWLQTQDIDMKPYRKYRYLLWLFFPLGVLVILSGGLFYMDGVETPTYAKVLYAMLYKPIFQAFIVGLIFSCIFEIESFYRGILEWRGWAWLGRASYGGFLLHTVVQRGAVGAARHMVHVSDSRVTHFLASTTVLSFVGAAILWMTVESPISQITNLLFKPKKRHLESNMAAANPATNGAGPDGQTKL